MIRAILHEWREHLEGRVARRHHSVALHSSSASMAENNEHAALERMASQANDDRAAQRATSFHCTCVPRRSTARISAETSAQLCPHEVVCYGK